MGSPASGVIFEVVLQRKACIAICRCTPLFGAWYVDETFVIIDRDMLSSCQKILNNVDPEIQFIMEEKIERTASTRRLDTPSGQCSTSDKVHKKPTVLTIFYFFATITRLHAKSCLKALFSRIIPHCSTPDAKKNGAVQHLPRQRICHKCYTNV